MIVKYKQSQSNNIGKCIKYILPYFTDIAEAILMFYPLMMGYTNSW